MSWFKSLATKVVKSKFGKVMDTAVAAFAQPVSTIKAITTKATFKEQTEKFYSKPLSTQISKIAVSGAAYIGAVYGGSAIAARGVGVVAKSLIPATLKGKAIAFVAAPAAAAYVIQKPEVLETLSELPATGFQAGGLAADPTIKGAVEFIKEHPVVTAAAVVAGGAGAIYAGGAVAKLIGGDDKVIVQQPAPAQQIMKESPIGIGGAPQTQPTQLITPTKKPTRRRRATKPQQIRQSVRLNIINRSVSTGTKNTIYLKERLLN